MDICCLIRSKFRVEKLQKDLDNAAPISFSMLFSHLSLRSLDRLLKQATYQPHIASYR